MMTSTVFDGGECCEPVHKECLKDPGHKRDPGMTFKTCGTIGERAQVILV